MISKLCCCNAVIFTMGGGGAINFSVPGTGERGWGCSQMNLWHRRGLLVLTYSSLLMAGMTRLELIVVAWGRRPQLGFQKVRSTGHHSGCQIGSTSAGLATWRGRRIGRCGSIGGIANRQHWVSWCVRIVTPCFKAKLNAHSMCAQESSLHTYRTEIRYRITNVTIYSIYYQIMSYKKLSRILSEASQRKDAITP
jgi:hypothetical protein